ncbi:SCO family protein [Cupriavidus oxalaticus]|uniref:SCO family protein n=1 Tax=Cupriavidus oxalaticus TaxID=96344 RepID=A0A4V1BZJ2_9BURK|nr:SCO family protein [Cupriavidus oxalaticus]QBY55512.1 SCO family protein [Cupriavidus oxalaticus]
MRWNRRAWLRGISGSILAIASRDMYAHVGIGPVNPPLAIPDTLVIDDGGQKRRLVKVLSGGVSAVQTMFTGCSSVCPLQGALFSAVQEAIPRLRSRYPVRLLSVSIDPLADTPDALRSWLKRYDAGPAWHAVTPRIGDVEAIRTALAGRAPSPDLDRHATQVYFFDKAARLCWRSTTLPPSEEVLRVLEHLAKA